MRTPASVFQRLAYAVLLVAAVLASHAAAQAPPQAAVPGDGSAARAHRLDRLFSDLGRTKVEDEADAMVAEIWKLWLQSGQPDLDAALQQATGLINHGLPALAIPALDDIVAQAPGWAEAWNKRATVLFLMGEHDRSLADIDRVLALEPRHFGALAGMGLIRIQKGELRLALAAYRRALAVNPFLKERFQLVPELERQVGERPL